MSLVTLTFDRLTLKQVC